MVDQLVVGSVIEPARLQRWLNKRAGIFAELDRQLIIGLNDSEKGLTLEHLQMVVEHKNPWGILGWVRFIAEIPMSQTEGFKVLDHFAYKNDGNISFDFISDEFKDLCAEIIQPKSVIKKAIVCEIEREPFIIPNTSVPINFATIWRLLIEHRKGSNNFLTDEGKENYFLISPNLLVNLNWWENGWRISAKIVMKPALKKGDRLFTGAG